MAEQPAAHRTGTVVRLERAGGGAVAVAAGARPGVPG
jgi:hypothetical protein